MGVMTRGNIVSEGMLLAGRDPSDSSAAAQSAAWLQRWLNSVAGAFPWVRLRTNLTATCTVGNTTVAVTPASGRILRILDGMYVYLTDNTLLGNLRVRGALGFPVGTYGPAATTSGLPTAVQVYRDVATGAWQLTLDVRPDKAYKVWVPVILQPADMTSDSDVPWYDNDETMVQAVAYKNFEFYDGKDAPVTQAAQQMLTELTRVDRARYGRTPGQNSNWSLDPNVFKPRRP